MRLQCSNNSPKFHENINPVHLGNPNSSLIMLSDMLPSDWLHLSFILNIGLSHSAPKPQTPAQTHHRSPSGGCGMTH